MAEHHTTENGLPDPGEMIARLLPRQRARLVIEVDLDPVPGWGNVPEDWRGLLQHYLDNAAPHYHPVVSLEAGTPPGYAQTIADPVEHQSGPWIDRMGDVWTLGADGLLHTPETRPFPREHVEKKWGPLRPFTDPEEAHRG